MNYLYKDVYPILYFAMNDLSTLNRILTVKIKLRLNWYTNKGKMNSTASNIMMCHSDP